MGIWKCRACKKVIAGGAWTLGTASAATVRSTIRRLRETGGLPETVEDEDVELVQDPEEAAVTYPKRK